MIGPTFRALFGDKGDKNEKSNFHFDIMAGKSKIEQIDILATARFGIQIMVSKHSFIDLLYGVNYLAFKNDIVEDTDKTKESYNETFGLSFGYSF